jgi:RNA polymerase sigma-70 factor (ECF subfamily)
VVRSNAELVKGSLAGDVDAFGELVRRYERAVWATAWRLLRDRQAAEDVAQETFLVAYSRLGEVRRPDSIGVWLLRIAHRQALLARRRRRPASSLDSHEEAAAPAISDPSTDLSADREEVLQALGELPEHERIVMALRYLDGHSVAAVAQITGRPVGTVTQQLSRAVRRLRQRFQSQNDPQEMTYESR